MLDESFVGRYSENLLLAAAASTQLAVPVNTANKCPDVILGWKSGSSVKKVPSLSRFLRFLFFRAFRRS